MPPPKSRPPPSQERQLYTGTVLTPDGDHYRVQFDQPKLGVHLVQDVALAPGKLAAPYFRAFDSAASCAPAPPPPPPSHRPLP